MKRSQEDLRRNDRRSAILSQRVSDKERAQLNWIQQSPAGRKATRNKQKKVKKRVKTLDDVRLDDEAVMLPERIQKTLSNEMGRIFKQYEDARRTDHRPYSLATIEAERERTDPLYNTRRTFYAEKIYGTDVNSRGGPIAVEKEIDRTRPLQYLGVDNTNFLIKSEVYANATLRLPRVDANEEFYAPIGAKHVLGRNLCIHDVVHAIEDTYDLTLFELKLLGPSALPTWLPHQPRASGMVALDCWLDEPGHFLLRFLYAVYAGPEDDEMNVIPDCEVASRGSIGETIRELNHLDEMAKRATLTRSLYHNLQVDIKVRLGQLPLQGLAFYYMAPTPDSDMPLDNTWDTAITM